MNALEVVVEWFVQEEINIEELKECLVNLRLTPTSVDRLVKRAQYKREQSKANKQRAQEEEKKANQDQEA